MRMAIARPVLANMVGCRLLPGHAGSDGDQDQRGEHRRTGSGDIICSSEGVEWTGAKGGVMCEFRWRAYTFLGSATS